MQQGSKTVKLFHYVDKGHVSMPDGAGHDIIVPLDAAGVMAYQQSLTRENLAFAYRRPIVRKYRENNPVFL